jgi:hypothetical protein
VYLASDDLQVTLAAKRHLVFNSWKLCYDENLHKRYYVPPSDDGDKKCWSLREVCSLNIEKDKEIEEDLIPLEEKLNM